MNERPDMQPDHAPSSDSAAGAPSELDLLIGRIVDGEASPAQRQHFESLAGIDPGLWRRLALRQQDMAMLAVHVEPALNAAEKVDLPASDAGVAGLLNAGRGSWWMAASGWAAVVVLTTAWGAGLLPAGPQAGGVNSGVQSPGNVQLASMPPEEHLNQYLQAPYVMGEMPPTLLQVDQISDGRYAVSYLRRIVEVQYYNSPEEIPLDEDGLSSSPHALRTPAGVRHAPPAPQN